MSTEILCAGAGSAKIRFPEALFPLEGFSGKIHDDPMARVLLLSCREQVAIVSLDLVMMLPPGVKRIKNIVSEITGTDPDHIWVHTTHAISTPHEPHAPWGGPKKELTDDEKKKIEAGSALFREGLETAVHTAALQAKDAFRPAKMGVGTGTCMVNVNRDLPTPFGWWTGFNPEGYSNHTATILRFDDADGKMIASAACFGMKACALDNSEMKQGTRIVSADVPGTAARLLEEQFGVPCLYLMGAACDQPPREMALYDVINSEGEVTTVDLGVAKGLEIVERLGREMAADFAAVIEGTCCDRTDCAVSVASGEITWGTKGRARVQLTKQANYVQEGSTEVETLAFAVGDVALVALRPEVNAITEKQLRETSPYRTTLMVTMVNGSNKYMPDQESYQNSSYSAQGAPLMPGAAEEWVKESVRVLNQLHL